MTAVYERTPAPAVGVSRRPLAHGAVTVPRPVPGAAVRLFLFHHAGGSHLLYRGWESNFPADWELCLLDAPGRGRLLGQPLISTSTGLVDFFLAELERWTGPPFAFFGHSMGALVAYELTLRLVRMGRRPPVWTGLSSCGAPGAHTGRAEGRHEWPDAALREWLRSVGDTPGAVLDDPNLWRVFGPVFRNDFALVDAWRAAPPAARLPVPLSAFGGTGDAVVRRERLAAWAGHTVRFHGPHMYRGGHFYLREHHASLAGRIIQAVSAARSTPPDTAGCGIPSGHRQLLTSHDTPSLPHRPTGPPDPTSGQE